MKSGVVIVFPFVISFVLSGTIKDYNSTNENNFFPSSIFSKNYINKKEYEEPKKFLLNEDSNEIKTDFECSLDPKLKDEILSYQPVVDKILDSVTKGSFKGKVYQELANFVDLFGNRISGTINLENSLNYVNNLLNHYKLENVHDEPVSVPHWVRGKENAALIYPRHQELSILGLGGSVGTPSNGITAEVLVVNSFEELHQKAELAKEKIVVFNQEWVSYPVSVKYRAHGAVEAAKVGALAVLIRSVTPMSLYSPHTGWQDYSKDVKKIPTASLTVEDAEMLRRISDEGIKIIIHLLMEAEMKPDTMSKNVVGDLTGHLKKDEIVLLSGHVDSWDVGQGAMDDGAGAFVSWFSLAVLKQLNLRPMRTIRAVLWTAEEEGLVGAEQYVKAHAKELDKFNLVMESDEGTFTPEGIEFSGTNEAACILKEIALLMKPLNATKFKIEKDVGSDITLFIEKGVPAADLINKNDKYFWYHHSNADTMTALNSDDLDKNVAMFAAVSFVVADITKNIPRRIDVPFKKKRKSSIHNKNKENVSSSNKQLKSFYKLLREVNVVQF